MFAVYTTPEKFKNGVFTLKTHEMFFVHTSSEKFKSATNHHFDFVFEKDAALFPRLSLRGSGAFRKRSSNWMNFKTPPLRFSSN